MRLICTIPSLKSLANASVSYVFCLGMAQMSQQKDSALVLYGCLRIPGRLGVFLLQHPTTTSHIYGTLYLVNYKTNHPSFLTAALTPSELKDLLQPETPLEASFLEDADFCRGLQWGVPRYGHPEGTIMAHIVEVNTNIDRLPVDEETRRLLRIVCWVHDTFKHIEDKEPPRDWSKHHGVYARKFLAQYVDDAKLLNLVEMHDDAYYAWRLANLYHRLGDSEKRISTLRKKLGSYWQLFYLFFKCDTSTGDKNPAPLIWFEDTMADIKVTGFSEEIV